MEATFTAQLIENKDKWQINDEGEIEFDTQALVDEYNGYLTDLQSAIE